MTTISNITLLTQTLPGDDVLGSRVTADQTKRDFVRIPVAALVGNVGPAGGPGVAGPIGPIGLQGLPGSAGTIGQTGLQGVQGAASTVPGIQGPPGTNGTAGTQGLQGVQGTAGAASTVAGPQGTPGTQGTQGIQGAAGAASTVAGPQGTPGTNGTNGTQGLQGIQGIQGLQGTPGTAGSGGGGSSIVAVTTIASSGTAQALAFPASGNAAYDVTLTGNCTFTLTGGTAGQIQRVQLLTRQDATGGRVPVLPGVFWAGNVNPVPDSRKTQINEFDFVTSDGGVTTLGKYVGSFGKVSGWRFWRALIHTNAGNITTSMTELTLAGSVGGPTQCVGGTASASSFHDSGYIPAYAFDGVSSTFWLSSSAMPPDQWLQYDFGSPLPVKEVRITSRPDGYGNGETVVTWDLQGSMDGATFTTVASYTCTPWTTALQVQAFAVPQ